MAPIVSVVVLALCAAISRAQDLSTVPGLASLPARENAQDAGSFFVNDANSLRAAAESTGNGFGLGLPESRAAVTDYSSPLLVAPHTDALPEPVPQNALASDLTTAAASDADAVAALTNIQPLPGSSADVPTEARSIPDAPAPLAAAAQPAPAEARSIADDQPRPLAAAAAAAPNEVRAASDRDVQPVAAVAAALPTEDRAAAEPVQPVAAATPAEPQTPVVAAPAQDANPAPALREGAPSPASETASKGTNFKSGDAESSEGSGGHVATFFAVGAACVLAVAAVAIARKRKNLKKKGSKTPGTPKNEMTFFHVQSRLTPPAV